MTNTEPLTNELNAAQSELEALRAEQRQIASEQAALSDANNFDADQLLELERRTDELPKRILAAEAKVLSLSVRIRELTMPDLIAEENQLGERAERARIAFERASAAYTEARNHYHAAHSARSMCQSDLATSQRALQDKIAELRRPSAPVVRSMPHTPKAA
jgi:chromosome segregation ATPase